VKDVRVSVRLSDSPSCIVTDENDPSYKVAALLKAMGHKDPPEVKPILEVNPHHEILQKLNRIEDPLLIDDISSLLLDQALLVEGLSVKDPADFVKRLNRILAKVV